MTGARRVVFIDLARAVAVVMMIQGHTIDTLLAAPYRMGAGYEGWLFIRGLTSGTFLTLSGVAFSITALRHWDQHLQFSPRWWRRVRRFTFFLVLGYFMRFPMGKFIHLPLASQERWESFFVVDILHLVATTLLALQALIWITRTPRAFGITSAILGALVVLLSPFAWGVDWTDHVPLIVASYLSPEWGSLFPAANWSAFLFAGAAFGVLLERWIRHDSIDHVAKVLITSGIATVAIVWAGRLLFFMPYGAIDERVSPGFFLERLGWVLVLLGIVTAVSVTWRGLPQVVQGLAEESLLIYAVHVAILYGSAWNTGLATLVGPQEPRVVGVWILALIAAMTLLGWVWNQAQVRHPRLAMTCRILTYTALVLPFLGS